MTPEQRLAMAKAAAGVAGPWDVTAIVATRENAAAGWVLELELERPTSAPFDPALAWARYTPEQQQAMLDDPPDVVVTGVGP